jgi:hypothetical protein
MCWLLVAHGKTRWPVGSAVVRTQLRMEAGSRQVILQLLTKLQARGPVAEHCICARKVDAGHVWLPRGTGCSRAQNVSRDPNSTVPAAALAVIHLA